MGISRFPLYFSFIVQNQTHDFTAMASYCIWIKNLSWKSVNLGNSPHQQLEYFDFDFMFLLTTVALSITNNALFLLQGFNSWTSLVCKITVSFSLRAQQELTEPAGATASEVAEVAEASGTAGLQQRSRRRSRSRYDSWTSAGVVLFSVYFVVQLRRLELTGLSR